MTPKVEAQACRWTACAVRCPALRARCGGRRDRPLGCRALSGARAADRVLGLTGWLAAAIALTVRGEADVRAARPDRRAGGGARVRRGHERCLHDARRRVDDPLGHPRCARLVAELGPAPVRCGLRGGCSALAHESLLVVVLLGFVGRRSDPRPVSALVRRLVRARRRVVSSRTTACRTTTPLRL